MVAGNFIILEYIYWNADQDNEVHPFIVALFNKTVSQALTDGLRPFLQFRLKLSGSSRVLCHVFFHFILW